MAADAAKPDSPYGPLPTLLGLLTLVTGFVDAVSYLKYGHVFVANMTGNIVFLGFAFAGARGISIGGSLVALAAFLVGAFAGGFLARRFGSHRGNLLSITTLLKFVLIGCAALVASIVPGETFAVPALLAVSMGLQNAAVRKLAVPDVTTTVLTLTLTGIAADSSFLKGMGPRTARRVSAVLTMFAGAFLGGWIVLHAGITPALCVAAVIAAATGILAHVLGRASPRWVHAE